jgi:molybdenum cofactor cytidylyltransferase
MRDALPRPGQRLAAIVLAAGASTRLGRSKQLVRRGIQPLLVRAARLALDSVDGPIIVVLGADALRHRSCLRHWRLPVSVAFNGHWSAGMAGSLRTGLRQIPPYCAGALVLLVDQARLTQHETGRLVDHWRRRPGLPAAACFDGRIGAPAVLPRRMFRCTRSISGDQGARRLLRGHDRVSVVAVPSAAFDLDTPADAKLIRRR